MTATNPAILNHLREATHQLHEALHVHPLLKPLTEESLTYGQYKAAIAAFHAAYRKMEASRSYKDAPCIDSPVLEWLEADMKQHKIMPVEFPATSYPVIDSREKLLGYLYVKQGSTLGGRVISRNLARILGLDEQTNRFFTGYGELTGEYWKKFIYDLENMEKDTKDIDRQAVASFEIIKASCDIAYSQSSATG